MQLAFLFMAAAAVHPSNAQADGAALFVQRALGTSVYKRADADLNGDGRPEALFLITDPNYCGSGGCTLVIVSPRGRSYRMVMRSTVTQPPIRLLPTVTHGWHVIGATVWEGRGRPDVVRMRFNGRRYPNNPTMLPATSLKRRSGLVLIAP